MATVNNTSYTQAAYQSTYTYDKSETKKEAGSKEAVSSTAQTSSSEKKTAVTGAGTYGKPELSEKALEYYNSLKKKYGNMNFVLVASDKKQEAEMMKGSFANANNLTVLIDTDKIERMATDEKFRAKYEAILDNAKSGLSQMKAQLGSTGASVKAFGMSFDKSGNASFFAVLDKSMAAQRERIEKKAEEKTKVRKEEAKKAAKEKQAQKAGSTEATDEETDSDTVTITADSMEELMKKVQDYYQQGMFNSVRTEEEKMVGSQIDYGV